jgi:hypothetical protein
MCASSVVVDTTNFRPDTHNADSSDRLHVVERFTRVDENTLRYHVTIDDHDWYTIPMNAPGSSPFNPNVDARSGVTTDDIVWNFFATHPKQ